LGSSNIIVMSIATHKLPQRHALLKLLSFFSRNSPNAPGDDRARAPARLAADSASQTLQLRGRRGNERVRNVQKWRRVTQGNQLYFPHRCLAVLRHHGGNDV